MASLTGTKPNQVRQAGVAGSLGAQDRDHPCVGGLNADHPTRGLGYTTGAGAAVTQATSKSTAVTLNTVVGQITLNNAALASATTVTFTVNNSAVRAADVPLLAIASGATDGAYSLTVTAVAAGSFKVNLRNNSPASLSEALVLNFALLRGSAA